MVEERLLVDNDRGRSSFRGDARMLVRAVEDVALLRRTEATAMVSSVLKRD